MPRKRPFSDQNDLIKECLGGNPAAWQRLQDTYLPGFRDALTRKCGKQFHSLVEELALQTFDSLFDEHMHRLLAFDAGLASFATYLMVLASQELARMLRARHGKGGKVVASRDDSRASSEELDVGVFLGELRGCLTPRELNCLEQCVLHTTGPANPSPFTQENERRLRQRIAKKARVLAYGEQPASEREGKRRKS